MHAFGIVRVDTFLIPNFAVDVGCGEEHVFDFLQMLEGDGVDEVDFFLDYGLVLKQFLMALGVYVYRLALGLCGESRASKRTSEK